MKILIVTQGDKASGAEIVTSELYEGNKQSTYVISGNEVQTNFFGEKGYNTIFIEGIIPLVRANFKLNRLFKVFSALFPLRNQIKNLNPDLIHVYNIPSLLYVTLSTFGLRKRVILHVHDFYSKDKLVRSIAKMLSRVPNMVVAVSNKVKEDLESVGFPKDKICVIHNGIRFTQETRDYNISKELVNVGFVGAISRWKGIDVLLKAAAKLNDIKEKVQFTIVGPFYDEEYKGELLGLASKVDFPVTFTGPRADARDCIKDFDIMVHCSKEDDPFPTVIIEGLFSGCAMIGSNCGGVPEMIIDGKTGLLHEPGSDSMLSMKLRELIEDAELRIRVSKAGNEFAKEYLTVERYKAEFYQVINNVLKQTSSRS